MLQEWRVCVDKFKMADANILNKLSVLWFILTDEEVNLNIYASKAGGCCGLSPEASNLVPWPFLELASSGEKRP